MAQMARGNQERINRGENEKASGTGSKRRRMGKSTTLSHSSSSRVRESTATPSSAQATMSSSRHTPDNSLSQAEKKELNFAAGERKVYQHNPKSDSSIGQDHFSVMATPTLNAKRSQNSSPMLRRKSSKRKAEDKARERELQAMSSPIQIPRRPFSYAADSSRRRDTPKAPARLPRHADRRASELSLPMPEPLSDIGIISNQSSFMVNALDVLSPRPTVRYNKNPRFTPSRTQIVAGKAARPVVAEEDFSSRKRIDDLADGLDARALRELMERDQRRREKKRKIDQAKLEQKLKRAAEHEAGQGVQGADPTGADGQKPAGPALSSSTAPLLDAESGRETPADPFADDKTIDPGLVLPPILRPGSSLYTRTSQASFSPPTSPNQRAFDGASLSQKSGLPREATPDAADTVELSRRDSEQSNVQLGSWTSFFRRGGTRGKRASLDPSRHVTGEFSNTSRDSISRTQPQIAMVGPPRTFRKSGAPQRTQSKFREDLPELPLSPPDSRVQSPEVGTGPQFVSAGSDQGESTADPNKLLANSLDREALGQKSQDGQLTQSQSTAPQTPSPIAVLSTSLASVDSEASWLSGKPAKRSSIQRDHPLRQSQSSLQPQSLGSDVEEAADVADDPYFSRLSPDAVERRRSSPTSALRRASSTALNLATDSESESERLPPPLPGNERWHSGLGRQPTLIRQAAQAKSKEGLLKEYQATKPETGLLGEETSDPDSPDVEDAELQASSSPILRAQSVNYGSGHIRHISAGSAKLLDIRHSSTESKRQSFPRPERSSTPIQSTAPERELEVGARMRI
jgi:hypothetical protein